MCICKVCGATINGKAEKCMYCGATLREETVAKSVSDTQFNFGEKRVCKVCGGSSNVAMKKCLYCGAIFPEEQGLRKSSQRGASSVVEVVSMPQEVVDMYTQSVSVSFGQNGKVEVVKPKSSANDIFAKDNWEDLWCELREREWFAGIILTNTTNEQALSAIDEYIEGRKKAGVVYCVLNLATQRVLGGDYTNYEEVVELLLGVYDAAVPNYLLIVGDRSVVPSAEWVNESRDDDKTVVSDLAYIALNAESPWDGVEYDFEGITQVGRVPTSEATGFKEAIAYFKNTLNFQTYRNTKAFLYSAKVWEATSKREFQHLRGDMITSPEYAIVERSGLKLLTEIDPSYNLLCFNLHGSSASHVWYGQIGNSYPEAFGKDLLTGRESGYMLLSEACYGARPDISKWGLGIVTHALMNNCVAFVGSTKIAYGFGDGRMACADIIACAYTMAIQSGFTCGEAFLAALCALYHDDMDETDIKTMAEFGLYGDPSIALIEEGKAKKKKSSSRSVKLAKTKVNKDCAISLLSCDESDKAQTKGGMTLLGYSEEKQVQIYNMAHQVKSVGQDYVMLSHTEVADVEPKVYKAVGTKGYRAVYSKEVEGIKTVVKIYMDDHGKVQKVYISK